MKDKIDAILQRDQARYLESLLPARDPLLARMERFAAENGHPIADPEVAQLMRVLVRTRRPHRIIEVGTNIGYSVIVMGREIDNDASIETIELDRATLLTAREFVADAALAGEIGANAFRFSISWSRVEPQRDRFDDVAIARYVRFIDALARHDIEPVVTLFHYTHPAWFHAATPWTSPASAILANEALFFVNETWCIAEQ